MALYFHLRVCVLFFLFYVHMGEQGGGNAFACCNGSGLNVGAFFLSPF